MLKISLLPLALALSLCSAGAAAAAKVQQLPGFAAAGALLRPISSAHA